MVLINFFLIFITPILVVLIALLPSLLGGFLLLILLLFCFLSLISFYREKKKRRFAFFSRIFFIMQTSIFLVGLIIFILFGLGLEEKGDSQIVLESIEKVLKKKMGIDLKFISKEKTKEKSKKENLIDTKVDSITIEEGKNEETSNLVETEKELKPDIPDSEEPF